MRYELVNPHLKEVAFGCSCRRIMEEGVPVPLQRFAPLANPLIGKGCLQFVGESISDLSNKSEVGGDYRPNEAKAIASSDTTSKSPKRALRRKELLNLLGIIHQKLPQDVTQQHVEECRTNDSNCPVARIVIVK